MDGKLVLDIFAEVFKQYGLTALFSVIIAAFLGATGAQVFYLRKFAAGNAGSTVQLQGAVLALTGISKLLEEQQKRHERFADLQREQTSALRSVGQELRGLVDAVHTSDLARARELMDVILQLSRVPQPARQEPGGQEGSK